MGELQTAAVEKTLDANGHAHNGAHASEIERIGCLNGRDKSNDDAGIRLGNLLGDLLSICLKLPQISSGELAQATRHPIDAGRLRQMAVKASDMITDFEAHLALAAGGR